MNPAEKPAQPLDRSFVVEGRRFIRHRIEGLIDRTEVFSRPAGHYAFIDRGMARVQAQEWARREGYRVLGVASTVSQDDGSCIVELEIGAPVSAGPRDGYDLSDPKGWRR